MSKITSEFNFSFMPIDCKIGNYSPIQLFHRLYKIEGTPQSKHNTMVMAEAEVEYLNKLLTLQKEIKEKYEPKLIDDSTEPFDCDKRDEWEQETYETIKIRLKPEAKNLYYT